MSPPSAIDEADPDKIETQRNLLLNRSNDSAPFQDEEHKQGSEVHVAPNQILIDPIAETKKEGDADGDRILYRQKTDEPSAKNQKIIEGAEDNLAALHETEKAPNLR